MTRKRFVKLVMSHGFSRNTAQAYADSKRAAGRTYEQAYMEFEISMKIANGGVDWEAIGKVFRDTVEVITHHMRAITAGMEAFSKAYRAELDA